MISGASGPALSLVTHDRILVSIVCFLILRLRILPLCIWNFLLRRTVVIRLRGF